MISLILKCDYENTQNFEASMNPSMAMDGFVEVKYDPISFDTQVVYGTQGKLMWESHTMDENETTWGKKTPRLCELLEVHPSIVQLS
jgi:hypothetical protein